MAVPAPVVGFFIFLVLVLALVWYKKSKSPIAATSSPTTPAPTASQQAAASGATTPVTPPAPVYLTTTIAGTKWYLQLPDSAGTINMVPTSTGATLVTVTSVTDGAGTTIPNAIKTASGKHFISINQTPVNYSLPIKLTTKFHDQGDNGAGVSSMWIGSTGRLHANWAAGSPAYCFYPNNAKGGDGVYALVPTSTGADPKYGLSPILVTTSTS